MTGFGDVAEWGGWRPTRILPQESMARFPYPVSAQFPQESMAQFPHTQFPQFPTQIVRVGSGSSVRTTHETSPHGSGYDWAMKMVWRLGSHKPEVSSATDACATGFIVFREERPAWILLRADGARPR